MPQPHPLENDVADLHALLTTSGVPGPYVLVAHSYGRLITALYASKYPKDVVGQVLVDATSTFLEDTLTPQEFAELDAKTRQPPQPPQPDVEGLEIKTSIEAVRAAPPAPPMPAIVLTADKPAKAPMAKNTALAWNEPQVMYSMPKPIFKSLMRRAPLVRGVQPAKYRRRRLLFRMNARPSIAQICRVHRLPELMGRTL